MRKLALVLVAAALVAAGCSKQETPGRERARPPVSLAGTVNDHGTKDLTGKGSSPELELELDDVYFGPTFVKAKPGATVSVELENEGKQDHTFTIDGLGIDQVVPAGKKAEVKVALPGSGVVNFYCRFHRSQGMQGAFFFART